MVRVLTPCLALEVAECKEVRPESWLELAAPAEADRIAWMQNAVDARRRAHGSHGSDGSLVELDEPLLT